MQWRTWKNDWGDRLKESLQYISEDDGFPNPLDEFQEIIGIKFSVLDNLRAALTHPSYWGEYAMSERERLERSYERLEFLGDSVLALTVCTKLFQDYPDDHQGILSKMKGHLVSKKVLLRIARELRIGEFIRVGKGVGDEAGNEHTSFMVDCFESVVGAIYIDFGFERARNFVLGVLSKEIKRVETRGINDYKTTLQEIVQKRHRCLPKYKLVSQTGPEHHKLFTIDVYIADKKCGTGEGHSKKEAEINAAGQALSSMNIV